MAWVEKVKGKINSFVEKHNRPKSTPKPVEFDIKEVIPAKKGTEWYLLCMSRE